MEEAGLVPDTILNLQDNSANYSKIKEMYSSRKVLLDLHMSIFSDIIKFTKIESIQNIKIA